MRLARSLDFSDLAIVSSNRFTNHVKLGSRRREVLGGRVRVDVRDGNTRQVGQGRSGGKEAGGSLVKRGAQGGAVTHTQTSTPRSHSSTHPCPPTPSLPVLVHGLDGGELANGEEQHADVARHPLVPHARLQGGEGGMSGGVQEGGCDALWPDSFRGCCALLTLPLLRLPRCPSPSLHSSPMRTAVDICLSLPFPYTLRSSPMRMRTSSIFFSVFSAITRF